jgi:hypothetical protein
VAVDQLSSTFAALADPTRRAILERLADGEATVNELAEPFPITVQAVSKHLKVLEHAGLIGPRGSAARRSSMPPTGSTPTATSGPGASIGWTSGSEGARIAKPMADYGFTVTRVFDAPRERVWREWTEPESFADWFGGRSRRCRLPASRWT